MLDVEVIEDPAGAVVALDPVRARLLAELAEPRSAAMLAERVGLTRQKVNYHLRTLESHGLVHVAEKRRWDGLTERLLVASAASYVVLPGALGAVASGDPVRTADSLSARYLIVVAARTPGLRIAGGHRVITAAWCPASREETRLPGRGPREGRGQLNRCCRSTATFSPAWDFPRILQRAARRGSQWGPLPEGMRVAAKG